MRAGGAVGTGLELCSSSRLPRTPGRRLTLPIWRSEKLGREAAARTERSRGDSAKRKLSIAGTDGVGGCLGREALSPKAAGSRVSDSASGLAWAAGAAAGWRGARPRVGSFLFAPSQAPWPLRCEVKSDGALPALVLRAWAG